MTKIGLELYANYALRELLPKEMQEQLLKDLKQTKGNHMILTFQEENERTIFISLCTKFGFQYKTIYK